MRTGDGFQKVIITGDFVHKQKDEKGILMTNVFEFLLDPQSL